MKFSLPERRTRARYHDMRIGVWFVVIGVCGAILSTGCQTADETSAPQLADFKSDGCSLFLDGTFKDPELWKACCVEHDVAYWKGGTEEEREAADLKFRECILKKTGDEVLARVMYEAVRAGGGPHFPSWYRWGYGWPLGRGYKALTAEENALADKKLAKYRESQGHEGNATH